MLVPDLWHQNVASTWQLELQTLSVLWQASGQQKLFIAKPFRRCICRWCDVGCVGWYCCSWSSLAADLHVDPSQRSLNLFDCAWFLMVGVCEDDVATLRSSRLAFLAHITTWQCRCFSCAQVSRLIFLDLLLALVDSLRKWSQSLILGSLVCFRENPGTAWEREFVTWPVPSSAADVCHHC